MIETCASCRFWTGRDMASGKYDTTQCHRYARQGACWPTEPADSWCGDYEPAAVRGASTMAARLDQWQRGRAKDQQVRCYAHMTAGCCQGD